jgi:hypothetical protein
MVSHKTEPIERTGGKLDLPGKKIAVRGRVRAVVEPFRRPRNECCVRVIVVICDRETDRSGNKDRTFAARAAVRTGRQQIEDPSVFITAGQPGRSCGEYGSRSLNARLDVEVIKDVSRGAGSYCYIVNQGRLPPQEIR